MKQFGQLMAISLVAIIFIPTGITILLGNNKLSTYTPASQQEYVEKEENRLLEEKMIGIVMKAAPINYEEETLKAQTVMARSHIALTQSIRDNNEAVSRMTIEEMKELWGNDFNRNYKKIKRIVKETDNIIVTYENKPIQFIYHLQSAGETQSSLDIWGVEVPYLKGVASVADQDANDLLKQKTYKTEEIIRKTNLYFDDIILEPYDLKSQIQIIERTQGGYVKSIQVGKQVMLGDDFRKMLGLLSSCFTLEYDQDQLIVLSKGVGHGVGLSQYGANEMAKQGKTYDEILQHYFPGTKVVQMSKDKELKK